MRRERERLHEIEARKAELLVEVKKEDTTEARLNEIRNEAQSLAEEARGLNERLNLEESLKPASSGTSFRAGSGMTALEKRAAAFRESNSLKMPLFAEERSLLVSSGKIAAPTAVSTEIGELPDVISSIVDDVEVIDATGTGSWKFPYKKTGAEAADVTEGSEIGGTGATFDFVDISPKEWGVLDEVSNQVKKMTNVAYTTSVQNSAYLALRKKARDKIAAAVQASELAEKRVSILLDENYLRTVVLGFGGDESVGGGTKLYLTKGDLGTLGKVRGTAEKKALYDITFDDENNGIIKDGGMAVRFSICSTLTDGVQLYGQPRSVKLLLWGDYEIATDDGGDFFKRNVLGVRALATAGADLAVWHGMQVIKQAGE